MEIRKATIDDLALVSAVEAECFPPAEAATKDSFKERLIYYGNHFWLLFEKGKLISFADGMVTNLTDLHDEHGVWQMIFGLNTVPACRKKGYAGIVLRRAIHDAEKEGRRGLVLTCKKELIHYYGKFGFLNEGISVSVHGNVVWYQMRLTF